jgi:hypothetical protein
MRRRGAQQALMAAALGAARRLAPLGRGWSPYDCANAVAAAATLLHLKAGGAPAEVERRMALLPPAGENGSFALRESMEAALAWAAGGRLDSATAHETLSAAVAAGHRAMAVAELARRGWAMDPDATAAVARDGEVEIRGADGKLGNTQGPAAFHPERPSEATWILPRAAAPAA